MKGISIAFMALCVVASASAQFSTFDSNDEGWRITGFSGSYALPPSGSTVPTYTTGLSGGGINTTDIYGETFFSAPASFTGNKSGFFGSNFSFDILITTTDNTPYPALILQGATKGLWWVVAPTPVGTWSHRSVPLLGSSFKTGSWQGAAATDADVLEVLSDLRGVYVNGEWHTGADDTTLDNVGFVGSTRMVSGTVELQNLIPDESGRTVTIQVQSGATVLETHTVTLGAGGTYSFATSVTGTRDIYCKGSHWLRKARFGVVIPFAGVSGINFSLVNADADGDNEITLADYAALSAAFGSVPGDGNWNAETDFDGDEEITLADYSILATNFGQAGD